MTDSGAPRPSKDEQQQQTQVSEVTITPSPYMATRADVNKLF
jgi:hypothetical protein